MASVHTAPKSVPGPLAVSPKVKSLCFALMALGVAAFVFTLFTDKERAWHAYLTGYFYVFVLAIGGLFFASIQHIAKAGWSVNVRRFSEALTAYLPVAFVGGLILLFGLHSLYEWTHTEVVQADPILTHKAPYLNTTFFIIRMVLFFALWMLFQRKMVGASVKQDQSGADQLTHTQVPWSIAFLMVFALSFSLFSVDLLMSLQPHWFSTIYGVYCFAGLFQSTMAFMILMILWCKKQGLLEGYVTEDHLHDLGKFMFAFTVFWAYIAYSQYMLMWYANMPEETMFYLPRLAGGWMWVSIVLLLFKFIVPFLALLSRRSKRNPAMLATIAVLILIMQYVDIYWLIYPNLTEERVVLGIPEVLIWLGFMGSFLFVVTRFLSQHPVVPIRDPRIEESLHHHVVY
ncbi:MAG TPA: molybdopterin oxidoreductase [Bdellovibrionales bacterium]|nr:molybdopterin oxidoreductase [Bdellovibrionales bacterium]